MSNPFENTTKFRSEGEKLGYILPNSSAERDKLEHIKGLQIFELDLNQGTIFTIGDPVIVLALLKIAKKYAVSGVDEVSAILNRCAKKEDFQNNLVMWYRRPYYHPSQYDTEGPKWITISEWLTEKGVNLSRERLI